MRKCYVTVVDTTQIQSYVFASNRLQENIGASYLVKQATEAWAFEAVRGAARQHNVLGTNDLREGWRIEDQAPDSACAEVVYAGGGNVVVVFGNADAARDFTRRLSRKVIEEAPGLQIVAATAEFDWDAGPLREAVKEAFERLGELKSEARLGAPPLLGLGVTVMCSSTSLPAVGTFKLSAEETAIVSAESLAKLERAEAANRALRNTFLVELVHPGGAEFDFPRDFDELGRSKGEDSHIAVIHADGNGLGKLVQQIGKEFSRTNREYIANMRRFAGLVKQIARDALGASISTLISRIDGDGRTIRYEVKRGKRDEIELNESSVQPGARLLPMRPLVYGGDDLTLVCDGRLGLSLAVEYLHQFEASAPERIRQVFGQDADAPIRTLLEGRFSACAGVSIVKSHYPFSRAYDLSEALCDEAKRYRAQLGSDGSYLDWHQAMSGVIETIGALRRREYAVRPGSLALRPVSVAPDASGRAWPTVERGILAFQGGDWASQRNKIKALREALRGGPATVKDFRYRFLDGKSLPDLGGLPQWPESGWQSNLCGYFDAIELMDSYIPLVQPSTEVSEEAVHAA